MLLARRLGFAVLISLGCAAAPATGGSGGSAGTGGSAGVGGTGTGGSGGAGGSGGSGVAPGDMIDDLEDGDASIIRGGRPPRVGAWYTYHDHTAAGAMTYPTGMAFVPAPGGANGTAFAARFAGNGFTMWGAGMGFNINDPGDGMGGSMKMQYDASSFHAITFYAKATGPMRLRVNISNKDTDAAGGHCMVCEDDFGEDFTLGTDWQSFTMNFTDMKQIGFGDAVPTFDASAIYAIHFQVAMMPFDVEVDEIGFLK